MNRIHSPTRLRTAAVAMLAVNIAVHVALTPDHLTEAPVIGALFIVGSVALVACIAGLYARTDSLQRAAWWGGSVISLIMLVLFAASRTVGLPHYPELWEGTTEDWLGVLCGVTEVAYLLCCAWAVRPGTSSAARA